MCRTDPESARHKGLSYLLVPMDQPGVDVRPITQLTRTSEFNEVFFDGARTSADNVVGGVGDGWRVALATLAFERGVALLGFQLGFRRELDRVVALAEENGTARDPVVRQRLAQAHIELTIMRYNTLRSLAGVDGPVAPPEASIAKLYWGSWHRRLGELAMAILGSGGDRPGRGAAPRERRLRAGRVPALLSLRRVRRPFTVGPTRFSATSSASGCSACRPSPKGWREHQPRCVLRPAAPPPPPGGHGLLEGKVVVVTAAAGTGIGSATARRCLEEGASVVLSDAHERRLAETAEQLAGEAGEAGEAGGSSRVHALACDVRDEAQVVALYDGALARFGRIDVAVHNAGLGGTVPLVEMTDEQWSTVLDITLTGTFRCTRAALTRMLPRQRGGHRQQRLGARLAGPGRARRTTPRPRRASWHSPGARRPRRRPPGCGSTPCRPAWPSTRS